ncbi:lupus La protein [Nematocida displodere]|uniref:Lupus La protein n=1 Tax=Nematocida displodere TaxID=1805483 RepID=A0A177EB25_9MICR|nr:lupus La protein [Nematocida displodere]
MTPQEKEAICKRVEFYFSDANIVRDAFLKNLLEVNDGWAPLSVINKFNRMKTFNKTPAELEEALGASQVLEVDSGRIRRKAPVPENHNALERTLLIKNLPLYMTMEDVEEYFSQYSDKIALIRMRRDDKKVFRGSIFLELISEADLPLFMGLSLKAEHTKATANPETTENTENAANTETTENPENVANTETTETTENTQKRQKVLQEVNLEIYNAKDYFEDKKKNREFAKEEKRSVARQQIVDSFKNKIFTFTLTPKEGTEPTAEEVAEVKISDIKEAVPNTAFVDIPNKHIRMKAENDSLPTVEVKDFVIVFTKLSDDEVDTYCKGLSLDSNKRVSRPRK